MPYRLGYVPIYNIWWAEQDLNLQVVSDQRFSRLLPHHPDIRHIFGASHGTRTRTRKSELPPQDSVSTKFHQERILCLDIADKP